jgi:sodium transport system permease protein
MSKVSTIFRKELIDTLRDRRTLITMIVIPLLLFPLLISISSRMMMSQAKKAREKVLKIGLVTQGNAVEFKTILLEKEDVRIIENITSDSGQELVKQDSLDGCIVFDEEFDEDVDGLMAGRVMFYYKGTEDNQIGQKRMERFIEKFENLLRDRRFENMNLDPDIIETVRLQKENLATAKERLADVLGGLLPYLFIIFCFMGSMYPAIDLAAGEKERGTLETLLTSPVSRLQILLGKFGVVTLTGIVSAGISFIGMYVGIRQVREIPPELLKTVLSILEVDSILLLLSLLIPLTIFFAALLLSMSIFARSFKEAQSTISPMMIVVIVPAFIGIMPGMKLSAATALIPILNVSLATKAIIAGTIAVPLLVEVYLSLIVLAGLSLFICTRIFASETTIFRGT